MKKVARSICIFVFALFASMNACLAYDSEYVVLENHKVQNDYSLPLPYEYIKEDDLPDEFTWGNVKGISYLSRSLNQHIPQYCGSCWAHGALSSLADRVKIARKAKGIEINLSIQFILNCGGKIAGSCHGGSHTGAYEFIKSKGYVPFDTCMPYVACSSESSEGFCSYVDTSCSAVNTCRTCPGFKDKSEKCEEVDYFPNVTIAEYGSYGFFETDKVHKIKAEIFARGPVAASINAFPLDNYKGGIINNGNWLYKIPNHIVSIVGWGKDKNSGLEYWIVRNSWGEYWGEMGFFRIVTGKNSLGIEGGVAWATPKSWTEHSFHPTSNDIYDIYDKVYVDPSVEKSHLRKGN